MNKINPFLIVCFLISSIYAQQKQFDLAEVSLQELANIRVTLVSKKEEKVVHSAAAVFVLTREDIQRSGATSIPEVLRLVPGFQVARIDANKWAVTTRGFIGRFSNKLLVLIDGRNVYSPLFSGVFWSMQDVMLEDIDRIEVIRGPGATLWGANAVNGIINIITKHSKETQGGLISGGTGTEERAFGTVRYGKTYGEHFYIRGFSKVIQRDNAVHVNDKKAADGWSIFHGGFRADWEKSPSQPMTLLGEFYSGSLGHTLQIPTPHPPRMVIKDFKGEIRGGHMQFHSQTIFNNASVMNLQSYIDYTDRDEGVTHGRLTTFNVDMDYLFDMGRNHQVICGIGYRAEKHVYENTFVMSVYPNERTQNRYSAFIQDDFQVIKDLCRLTLGSKFEHHYYTGLEVQPNIRALFTPGQFHTFWTAVSRAVRTPSLAEVEGHHIAYLDSSDIFDLPTFFGFLGNPNLKSETLIAYELGYRYYPTHSFLLDIASFYHQYDNIVSARLGTIDQDRSPDPEYYIIFATDENKIAGNIYGIEILMDWQVLTIWRFQCSASFTDVNMHTFGGGTNSIIDHVANLEGQCPHYQGFLKSCLNLSGPFEFDITLRTMDALPELGISRYTNMDCRLGVRLNENMKIELLGQNLLKKSFLEFVPELNYTLQTKIQRGVYTKFTWTF